MIEISVTYSTTKPKPILQHKHIGEGFGATCCQSLTFSCCSFTSPHPAWLHSPGCISAHIGSTRSNVAALEFKSIKSQIKISARKKYVMEQTLRKMCVKGDSTGACCWNIAAAAWESWESQMKLRNSHKHDTHHQSVSSSNIHSFRGNTRFKSKCLTSIRVFSQLWSVALCPGTQVRSSWAQEAAADTSLQIWTQTFAASGNSA